MRECGDSAKVGGCPTFARRSPCPLFTEVRGIGIFRSSSKRSSQKFIYAILQSPGPIAWVLTWLTPSTYLGEWPVLVYFFPPPRHITISVARVMGRNDASKEERTSIVEERFSRGWIGGSNIVGGGRSTPGDGRQNPGDEPASRTTHPSAP
jgi:hypothetical protein